MKVFVAIALLLLQGQLYLAQAKNDKGCCSQNGSECANWCKPVDGRCTCGDGSLVFLPNGAEYNCGHRWNNFKCSSNADCCGGLVCDGTASNPTSARCRHPIDFCKDFRSEEDCTGTRVSFESNPPSVLTLNCAWENNQCVPGYDVYGTGAADNLPFPANKAEAEEVFLGCCSQNFQNCNEWCKPVMGDDKCGHCSKDGNYHVFLPRADELPSNCKGKWTGGACQSNDDCCATLVCDSVYNSDYASCRVPEEVCTTYPNAESCEAGRLATVYNPTNQFPLTQNCIWENGACAPIFDWREDRGQTAELSLPGDIEDLEARLAGCCSQDHKNCATWCSIGPNEDCSVCGNGDLVWLPQKGLEEPNKECMSRWEGGKRCSSNEDCCGSLVCDGTFGNPSWTVCHDPVSLCATWNATQEVCEGGRISYADPENPAILPQNCAWENDFCVPNFDWTVAGNANDLPPPANAAELEAIVNGCCSADHKNCANWCKPQLGDDPCGQCSDGSLVFLPEGDVEKDSQCKDKWKGGQCHTNEDCCGTLVCDGTAQNLGWVTCKDPGQVCSSFTSENSCILGRWSRASWSQEAAQVLSQNCIWEDNTCKPAFDYKVKGRGVRPSGPTTQPIPADALAPGLVTEDNPDFLGLCKGYVGSVWGDPHFVTFDREEFDCQAHGEFILVDSPGKMKVQARLTIKNNPKISVLTGIAVGVPGSPVIQVGYAEYFSGESSSFYLNGDCAVHIYIGGVLQDVANGDILAGQGYTVSAYKSGVEIQFFDDETPTSSLKIKGGGNAGSDLGCVMTSFVCLTDSDEELLDGTVGLLGTPNSNPVDDWKVNGVDQFARVVKWGNVPFEHCTTHYCVDSEDVSLFVHEDAFGGEKFEDLSNCAAPYPGDIDLTDVPPEIAAICGDDKDCLLEGVAGGEDNAVQGRAVEDAVKAIQASPELVDISDFDVDPAPVVPLADETCPEDVNLVNTFGVTRMPSRPIRVIGRDQLGFILEVKSAAFSNMKKVYIEYKGADENWICATSSPEFFFNDPLHVFCPPHLHSALVHVTASDPSLSSDDQATVGECCHAEGDTNPKVKYTFLIPCVSVCPEVEETAVRRLRRRN